MIHEYIDTIFVCLCKLNLSGFRSLNPQSIAIYGLQLIAYMVAALMVIAHI